MYQNKHTIIHTIKHLPYFYNHAHTYIYIYIYNLHRFPSTAATDPRLFPSANASRSSSPGTPARTLGNQTTRIPFGQV